MAEEARKHNATFSSALSIGSKSLVTAVSLKCCVSAAGQSSATNKARKDEVCRK